MWWPTSSCGLLEQQQQQPKRQQQRLWLRTEPCALPQPHRSINATQHHLQGNGERAEEQFSAAAESGTGRWGDLEWVRQNTRWPPALEQAYSRFLGIQSSGSSGT